MFNFNKIYREAEGVDGGGAAPEGETPVDNTPPADTGVTPPADDATPPKEGDTPPADTPPADDVPKGSEFKLPEEFKDKPWAAKIKSEDDLYKQIDNLTTLAGKKNAYPSADATPEQLDEYFQGLRPESKEAYDFGEDHPNPDVAAKFGDMLFDAGVSKHQGQKLIEAYNAFEKSTIEEATSAEGFETIMTEKFGKEYDGVVTNVSKSLTEHTSKETQDILNKMPNQYLGAMYEAMDSFLKAYGANEGGDNKHTEKAGLPAGGKDINEVRANLRAEMRALDQKPHTAEQKQKLIDELQATYTNQK